MVAIVLIIAYAFRKDNIIFDYHLETTRLFDVMVQGERCVLVSAESVFAVHGITV